MFSTNLATAKRRKGRGGVMRRRVNELYDLSIEHGKGKLVCVHGMGGVGKTRLFEELYQKFLREGHHIQVVMIKVTEDMDVKKIQRDIARRLMLGWENEDERVLASRISDSLKENGEYVFLFDDVWEELPLSSIGIRCEENTSTRHNASIPRNCMVVFSTRISALCRGADHTISLKCLPFDKSWSLFLENTGWASKLLETDTCFQSLAIQIVEECGGLPLALINAGQAFSGVTEVAELKKGVDVMKREPWKIDRMAGNVLQVLRRSYDNLSSDCLRLCFTYFVLIPRLVNTGNWLRMLTLYWIEERVIEHWTDINDADAMRDQLIDKLEDVGLVTPGDSPRLHKMVRAMAVWLGISTERFIAMPEICLSNAQAGRVIRWNDARRISLEHNDIRGGWPQEPNWPELLTLLIWQNNPSRALPNGFFRKMRSLKVLTLFVRKELPMSIGELHSLEFLHLSMTKTRSLPREIGNLVRLRFLNLNDSQNLEVVPCGIFGKLTKLEFLGLYNTYSKWGMDADGATIHELSGLEHLKYLSITIDNIASLETLVASTHLQSITCYINLRQLNGKQSIQLPEKLWRDTKQLKCMTISDSEDLEEIVFDGDRSDAENMYGMELFRLTKAKIIFRAYDINDDRCCLRNLKWLKIAGCNNLEELVKGGNEGHFTFPSLEGLWLEDLPKLKSICRVPLEFPSLVTLHVVGCPNLRRLPFGEDSGRILSEIEGSLKWWDNLYWGDPGGNLKLHFSGFFRQI